MKKSMLAVVCSTAMLAAFGTTTAVAQNAKPPIKIGEINSYSGALASFTGVYRNGISLAVEQINAKGGVLGRKLEVIHRDDALSPATAVRMASELVLNEKVDLLAGSFLSGIGLALSSYAQQHKVLYVATEPLSNQLTWSKGSRYVYRVEEPIMHTSAVMAQKAENFGCTKWAGTGPVSEAITDWYNNFQTDMKKAGKPFTWEGQLDTPIGKINAGSAVDFLQRSGAQCVLIAHAGPDLVAFIREARARDFLNKVKFVALQIGNPEWRWAMGDSAPEGWIVTGVPDEDPKVPAFQQFVKDYRAAYKHDPGLGSLIGYLAIQAIAAGIEHTGSTDTEAMVKGFKGAKFDCAVGKCYWRLDHQLNTGGWIGTLAVKDGKAIMVNSEYVDGDVGLPTEEEGLKLRPPGSND